MCTSLSDGGARCATHTRPGYLAVMVEATSLTAAELRRRIDAHPDALLDFASTKSGAQQLASDIFALERHYEHTLADAAVYSRRRLRRDQDAVLAAIHTIHTQAHARREATQHASAIIRDQHCADPDT